MLCAMSSLQVPGNCTQQETGRIRAEGQKQSPSALSTVGRRCVLVPTEARAIGDALRINIHQHSPGHTATLEDPLPADSNQA